MIPYRWDKLTSEKEVIASSGSDEKCPDFASSSRNITVSSSLVTAALSGWAALHAIPNGILLMEKCEANMVS